MKLVDISVPIRDAMAVYRGNPPVRIRPAMTLPKDGVNLSELCLGSHTGTHVDAPSHFIKGGKGSDWGATARQPAGAVAYEQLALVAPGACLPDRLRLPRP